MPAVHIVFGAGCHISVFVATFQTSVDFLVGFSVYVILVADGYDNGKEG